MPDKDRCVQDRVYLLYPPNPPDGGEGGQPPFIKTSAGK